MLSRRFRVQPEYNSFSGFRHWTFIVNEQLTQSAEGTGETTATLRALTIASFAVSLSYVYVPSRLISVF